MRSILITQCIQNDFIGPLRKNEPLPNTLHVGQQEALRLLGTDPENGPLGYLLNWAMQQEELEIIHIRDWHDDTEPKQKAHLDYFGKHCLKNTKGAMIPIKQYNETEARGHKRVHYINATGLNDFEGTGLAELLNELLSDKSSCPDEAFCGVRVGVIGVWTDAKISFLLYDLKTRVGIDQLATCSALTASRSRLQHFNALKQLHSLFGVHVLDSVGAFAEWLLPQAGVPQIPHPIGRDCSVDIVLEDGVQLCTEDIDIINYIYSNSKQVILKKLSGGFSGALIFQAKGYDIIGHEQAPSCVKLGPRNMIATERVNFEQVEEVMGNNAPVVRGYIDMGTRAGIKFAYASMAEGQVDTFESFYKKMTTDNCKYEHDQDHIDSVLQTVFGTVLGRFYAASQYEHLDLMDYYQFDGKGWAYATGGSDTPDKVRERIQEFLGPDVDPNAPTLIFPGDFECHNVVTFLERDLAAIKDIKKYQYNQVSYVHGDLNGANILLDSNKNVWLIDFFYTSRGHILKDITKIEADLQYQYTKINNEQELIQALMISRTLSDIEDIGQPLPDYIEGLNIPELVRAYNTLKTLRKITAQIVKKDRSPYHLNIVLLRYALFAATMRHLSKLQKTWALAAACMLAKKISASVLCKKELVVYWLDKDLATMNSNQGNLGVTILPGRKDKNRILVDDLQSLKSQNVKRIVCICTNDQLEWAGVENIKSLARNMGFEFYHKSSIKSQAVPTLLQMKKAVNWVVDGMNKGENVVICSMAGLGRAPVVAAGVLVLHYRMQAEEAIELIRNKRGVRAFETVKQEQVIHKFKNVHLLVPNL